MRVIKMGININQIMGVQIYQSSVQIMLVGDSNVSVLKIQVKSTHTHYRPIYMPNNRPLLANKDKILC